MATTGGSFDREKLLERLCGGKFDQASAGEPEAQVESIVEATKQVLRHVSGSVKPPLYALIIGINDYETIPPLAAAAPDAIEFKKFLTDDLLVPEEQITLLLNKEATRDGIIKAFQNVANDKRIQKDDPIVIYYAGHGSEINPPPDRAENGPQVQCIIPQNISKATGVVAIPDFTVGALLTQIANAKGDNITVIFDCCHSAGGSRDFEGSRFVDKSLLPELPRNPDAAVIKTATEGTRALIEEPDGFLTAGMASHVLLAACSHAEVAFENGREGHGYFSMALLKLLRSIKVDNITYKGCMQRLPALRTRQPQNPVCEGKNIDRIFFNAKVPGANSQFIAVKLEGIRKTPFLQAGLAQGVTPGCTFAIHSDCVIGPNNPVLGSLVVAESEPFRSLLKPLDGAAKFTIPAVAYGRQTGYGEDQALDVHITEGFVNAAEQDPKWGRAFSGGQSNVVLRPCTEDLAQLVVGINPEGEAVFTTSNPTAIAYGIQELPFTVPPTADAVVPVLRAAARWNYHLRRMPGSRPFQKSVQMEFYKLDRGAEFDAQGNPILKPVGENLNQGGEADIVLGDGSKKDPYGFKITNTSSRDLYAYLFFFSIPDQAIIPKFNRTIGPTKVDPSLPQNVPLTLGYGSGGERPLMFKLDPGVDCDVGVFKMFITTDWADFDSLKQTSPFEGTRADVSDEEVEDQLGKQPLWDVITMNLVQRRYPKPAEQPKPVPEPVKVEEAPQPQESAKPDEPAPAEGQGQGQTVFTGKSENPASVQSYGPNPNTLSWFRSPVLTKSLLDSITNMRLRTLSREQAPAGNNAEGAWFDLYVIDSEGIPKVSPDYQPLAFKSHQSPRGTNLVWTDGTVFDRDHAIWKQVEVGDCFEVVVNAKGRGWSNIAQEGNLIFW